MAVVQTEAGICTGRGFGPSAANGFLQKLKEWIVKTPAAGGPEWYIVEDESAAVADPYIVVSDVAVPTANAYNTGKSGGAPKIVRFQMLDSEAGYVRAQVYCGYDTAVRGLWSGYRITTSDDADFIYDFRGGDQFLIVQTRIGTSWSTFVLDDFLGDDNLLEDATHVGTTLATVSAGSSVVLQLGAGQAANFTVDKYYYIYHFNSAHAWVEYVKVEAVDVGTDQITVDTLTNAFPDGSVIGSYPHRMYTMGSGTSSEYHLNHAGTQVKTPYCSYKTGNYVFHDQGTWSHIRGAKRLDAAWEYLSKMAPDDEGRYAVQRPGLVEYTRENQSISNTTDLTADQNRAYGICRNVYATTFGSMSLGQDGRVIAGNNWICGRGANTIASAVVSLNPYALLFPDTESLT